MSFLLRPTSRTVLACGLVAFSLSNVVFAQQSASENRDTNPILQLPAPPAQAAPLAPRPIDLAAQIERLAPDLTQQTSTPSDAAVETETEVETIAPVTTPAPVITTKTDSQTLDSIAKRLKLPLPLPQGRIVISKAARRLELWNGDRLVKRYRVNLGSNPLGHKQTQGDGRTPEGTFRICTRNDKTSAFHIFLGLDYPNVPDAQRGLQTKQITPREYQIIRQRLASRGAPLWRTRLGGWVGIHGGSDDVFAKRTAQQRKSPDWTAGCIALTNREIEELSRATKMGTTVTIRP